MADPWIAVRLGRCG